VLIAYVAVLSLACAGLTLAALLGWTADSFIAGMGALLCGCGAVGVLVGKVFGGSGDAPCPVCGAKIHDVERSERVEGILCTHCGGFLNSEAGELRPVDPDTVADGAIFGAALAEGFKWPPGCVVCGAPVTQELPVRVVKTDVEKSMALSAVGLAMAATIGVGFWVRKGKRVAVDVPHCAAHDDGAVLTEGGPTGFLLLFRSYPYQREFRQLNQTLAVESPETGRSAGSPVPPLAGLPRARKQVGPADASSRASRSRKARAALNSEIQDEQVGSDDEPRKDN
jgi:hypothetical protein